MFLWYALSYEGNLPSEGVMEIWQGVILTIGTFFKAKTKLCKYWTSIKIKISTTYVYKDYKVKMKMRSLWGYDMKIVI